MYRQALRYLILLLLFLSSACRPEPVEPSYIALPAVRYLADTRELRAQLVLYEGDSLAVATQPEVTNVAQFMGQPMTTDELVDSTLRYGILLRANYEQPLRFGLPFAGGGEEITLRCAPASIADVPDTIRRADGLRFTAGSDSLGQFESLLIHLRDSARQVRQVLIAGPSRAAQLSAPAASLSHIEPGRYELYLVKKWEGQKQQGPVKVRGLVEYYTETKSVVVE